MNSERFEAFIDAVLAIIITIIVLEIPLASTGTWSSLFEIKLDFIIYAISFIVCFSFWNFHQKIFSIVNKIDTKVIWIDGISLLILSFLPYLTMFVANNFNSLIPQALYGLEYIFVTILTTISGRVLKNIDKGNIALQIGLDLKIKPSISLIIIAIGYVIGFVFYPPAIIFACLFSLFFTTPISMLIKRIKNN